MQSLFLLRSPAYSSPPSGCSRSPRLRRVAAAAAAGTTTAASTALAIKSFRADACFLLFCFFYNISNEEEVAAAAEKLGRAITHSQRTCCLYNLAAAALRRALTGWAIMILTAI